MSGRGVADDDIAPRESRRRRFAASLRSSRSFALGAGLSFAFLAVALLSLVWTPYDPTALAIPSRLKPPSAAHWLGTDAFGRDVLSMAMAGARNSISVALIAVAVGLGIGVPLGALAAARGGWLDHLAMRGTRVRQVHSRLSGGGVSRFCIIARSLDTTRPSGPGRARSPLATSRVVT